MSKCLKVKILKDQVPALKLPPKKLEQLLGHIYFVDLKDFDDKNIWNDRISCDVIQLNLNLLYCILYLYSHNTLIFK